MGMTFRARSVRGKLSPPPAPPSLSQGADASCGPETFHGMEAHPCAPASFTGTGWFYAPCMMEAVLCQAPAWVHPPWFSSAGHVAPSCTKRKVALFISHLAYVGVFLLNESLEVKSFGQSEGACYVDRICQIPLRGRGPLTPPQQGPPAPAPTSLPTQSAIESHGLPNGRVGRVPLASHCRSDLHFCYNKQRWAPWCALRVPCVSFPVACLVAIALSISLSLSYLSLGMHYVLGKGARHL